MDCDKPKERKEEGDKTDWRAGGFMELLEVDPTIIEGWKSMRNPQYWTEERRKASEVASAQNRDPKSDEAQGILNDSRDQTKTTPGNDGPGEEGSQMDNLFSSSTQQQGANLNSSAPNNNGLLQETVNSLVTVVGTLTAEVKELKDKLEKSSTPEIPPQPPTSAGPSTQDGASQVENEDDDKMTCVQRTDKSVCPQCKRLFSTRNLATHVRRVHRREFSFHCEICGKGEAQRKDLIYHQASAHGVCSVDGCELAFPGSRQGLRSHQVDTHGKEIDVLACPECGKLAIGSRNLWQHRRNSHRQVQ